MKVTKFWAKGFRSLRDVTLSPLGDFNVFYGPNGAGKSNVLDAMQALFSALLLAVDTVYGAAADEMLTPREAGERASRFIHSEDFHVFSPKVPILLGATLEALPGMPSRPSGELVAQTVEVEIRFARTASKSFTLTLSRFLLDGDSVDSLDKDDPRTLELPRIVDELRRMASRDFTHLAVTRAGSTEPLAATGEALHAEHASALPKDLVEQLFRYKNAFDPALRQRFERVRDFLSQALQRPPFDVFMDPVSGRLELREPLPEPNPHHRDLPIERAGHGVIALYAIVAKIFLAGGGLVAIEEPEAHLHAPTLGIKLRSLLVQLLSQEKVDQFFIATHSNLFDLDETGYFDVSLDPQTRETQIERKPLSEIDGLHLYEPGPAKHALAQYLRYADPSERVYRRPDNTPVFAGELLRLLQEDDPLALDFLRSMHGAALRMVRLDLQKPGHKP